MEDKIFALKLAELFELEMTVMTISVSRTKINFIPNK